MSELELLLAYRGARADHDGRATAEVEQVGAELIAVRLWTPEFCAALIAACDAADAWASDPEDPVPGQELSFAVLSQVLAGRIEQHLAEAVAPAIASQWPLAEYNGLHDGFVIRYAADSDNELRLHHDVAQISGSVKLNADYEGGVLEFPRQGFDNSALPVGTLLMWPSLVTHPHRSTPVTGGVKYGATLWFALPAAAQVQSAIGSAEDFVALSGEW